jgi:hypothetical protein
MRNDNSAEAFAEYSFAMVKYRPYLSTSGCRRRSIGGQPPEECSCFDLASMNEFDMVPA